MEVSVLCDVCGGSISRGTRPLPDALGTQRGAETASYRCCGREVTIIAATRIVEKNELIKENEVKESAGSQRD